jgi:hypothetical protein
MTKCTESKRESKEDGGDHWKGTESDKWMTGT